MHQIREEKMTGILEQLFTDYDELSEEYKSLEVINIFLFVIYI